MKARLLLAAVAALLVVALAACGSDSGDSTNGGTGGGETAGGEASEQTSFTYGYSIPTGQNPWITAIADVAQSTADAAGGEGERADSRMDPANEVTQINRFVNDGDDVIAVAPAQVPEAVQATLDKAVSGGSATLALEWSFAAGEPEAAPTAPVQGQVNIDRELLGQEVAEAVNENDPSGAKVIYVGLPFPVASIDFFQESMEEALGKSEVVADIDNPTDNAQGALGPLNGALGANPEATAIVTYNGPSALAGVQAVESAGLQGKVDIYNIQIDTPTAKALRQGTITACWDLNPPELGTALGELMVAAGSGEPESEWAKTVAIPAVEYTKENIDSWEDWLAG